MWFSVTVVYIVLSKCSSLGGQVPGEGGFPADPNLHDMAYKRLSPEAFFSMKDTLPNPVPPMIPIGPERPMKPSWPAKGPMQPDMGPMRPGMGPMRPGMGPMRPGMGSMKPGSRPGKPVAPGMGLIDAPIEPVGMKGYEHFELSTLDDISRQAKYTGVENYGEALKYPGTDDEQIIYNLCYAISYIWRRGRESIRKYFHLRDIYHNHLPFEVGYITHVIMSKYQTMLELYEFSASLASMKNQTITSLHLTVFQKTIDEDGYAIQHLCNMLHELKTKYSFQPYDPGNKFDIPPPAYYNETTITESTDEPSTTDRLREGKDHKKIDKAYIAKKIEESHKVIDEVMGKRKKKLQESRDFYKKHGYLPTTTRVPQQPMRLWSPNLDYGWSGEEDW